MGHKNVIKKRVLVVDDDVSILEVIKIILEDGGYEVSTAQDILEVKGKIGEVTPDLILLDIWLSGGDGGKIAEMLKKNSKTCSIPIIMISAHNDGRAIALKSKVDGFLAKPFDMADLLSVVKKHTAERELSSISKSKLTYKFGS